MQIDLTKLLNSYIDNIEINSEVNIPTSLLESSLITELKNINLNGDITLNEDDNLSLTGELSGTPEMVQKFRNFLDKNAEEVKGLNGILENDYDM